MREIKFRAWDSHLNVMRHNIQVLDTLNEYISRDRNIVEQYTGLKDANGIEMYEGDILIVHGSHESYHDTVLIVVFNSELSAFGINVHALGTWQGFSAFAKIHLDSLNRGGINYTFEVIGDIHRNPELLNDGSNPGND